MISATPDTSASRLWPWLLGVAVLAFVAAAAGTGVRATYGAQTTADEPQYLLSALSLFEDADLDIFDELSQERWRDFHEAQLPEQTKPLDDGRRVSPHDPFLPLLLAVPMGLGGWVAAKLAMAVFAAAVAALTLWLAARRFGVPPLPATAVVAVFSASTPLAVYGSQIYPELPAALAVLVAVAALTGDPGRRWVVILGVAVIALPWLATKYVPVAAALAALGLLRLWRTDRRRVALILGVSLGVAGVAFVGAHLVIYGGLTSYASGDHFVGGEFTAVGSSPNYAGRSVRLIGLLVDREFGLAAWQPAYLMLVPALTWLVVRRPVHWEALALPLAAGWLTATYVALTMHGYWFPGRQIVVVLPLGVIALAMAAQRLRGFAPAVIVLGLIGTWSYVWLVVDGVRERITWVVDFFLVGDPWYRAWSQVLPAYRHATGGEWARHAVWLVVAVAAVLATARWRPMRRAPQGQ